MPQRNRTVLIPKRATRANLRPSSHRRLGCRRVGAGEPTRRPDSVGDRDLRPDPEQPSIWWRVVTDTLVRPTRRLGRAALPQPLPVGAPARVAGESPAALLGLAPGGVYPAAPVTRSAGGLLHHRFTLTRTSARFPESRPLAVCLCGTVPRVTSGGCYPPPCPAESGPSSTSRRVRRESAAARSARPRSQRIGWSAGELPARVPQSSPPP